MDRAEIDTLDHLLDRAAAQLREMKAPRSMRERIADAGLSVDWLRRETHD